MTGYELLFAVLVIAITLLLVNPYGAFIFAIIAQGVTTSQELWIMAFTSYALLTIVTLVVKGRTSQSV